MLRIGGPLEEGVFDVTVEGVAEDVVARWIVVRGVHLRLLMVGVRDGRRRRRRRRRLVLRLRIQILLSLRGLMMLVVLVLVLERQRRERRQGRIHQRRAGRPFDRLGLDAALLELMLTSVSDEEVGPW